MACVKHHFQCLQAVQHDAVHLVCFVDRTRRRDEKYFSYRVTVVERIKKLIQTVEVLDIFFGLVGCISNPGVQFSP